MIERIGIFGAGGFGREMAMLIGQINQKEPRWELVGFFDDDPALEGERVAGIRVLGGLRELNELEERMAIVIALGSPQAKRNVFEAISNTNIVYPKLIHPDVILSEETDIGIGCVVCAGSILTVNIRLEDFVSLNLRCTVGHDSTIGAFSSVMPGVSISGEVRIENEVYIGTGAGILNQIEIGSGTIVGAGAVVNRSLPAYCTAVGVPARIIQQRQPEEL